MHKNVALSRMIYNETNYANGLWGLFKDLHSEPMFSIMKKTPSSWSQKLLGNWLGKPAATEFFRERMFNDQSVHDQGKPSGLASAAKFTGTDYGVKNCQMALMLMGGAGVRQDRGVEKILRDAKLLQIYEGTNQLNRLNLFKCLIASGCKDACVFEEKAGGAA
jgi:hypothetical protein